MIISTMMTTKNKKYQRIDVVTRNHYNFDELIRISFDKKNNKFYEINSKVGGKGFYLLPTLENFQNFQKRRFLERMSSFSTVDCQSVYSELETYIKNIVATSLKQQK